jgi:FMN phosphatase YigB (HAD superfamily)
VRIGCDVDGVLADFNHAFIERVIKVTGVDYFPPRPFDIPLWNYPEHYGYSAAQTSAVWESIKADRMFWRTLKPYGETPRVIEYLFRLMCRDHDVYFITDRPGIIAKRQTEDWFRAITSQMLLSPFPITVLISGDKAGCAQALNLDLYIDDRWENCEAVRLRGCTKVFLLDRPWNADAPAEEYDIVRVRSVMEIAPAIDLPALKRTA